MCQRVQFSLEALLRMVNTRRLFGITTAWVKVIELQRRALPHTHCDSFFGRLWKQMLNSPQNVDRIISIEISGEDDLHLQKMILKRSVHMPRGYASPDAVCTWKL